MVKKKGNPNPVIPENWGANKPMEERIANGRKGGLKYAENCKKRKRAQEILNVFLAMPLKKRQQADIEEIQAFEQLKNKNITVNEAIQLKQIQRALNGDLASAQYIRDTVGDKPVERVEMKAEVTNPFEGLTTEELRKIISNEQK